MRAANAVAARIALDLRVGAAMTRMQTLQLQSRFDLLSEKIISYGAFGFFRIVMPFHLLTVPFSGPCQFPTLGFVVDQYEKVRAFRPETFWYIHLAIERENASVIFHWQRNRLFDIDSALILYEMCIDQPEATVIKTNAKTTQK